MKKLKMLSLFDGSGGFPLAGQPCGIEAVAASEIEPFPIRVSHARFPNMKHLGSVTEINGGEIEPVDIVTFGSPCFPAGTLVNTSIGMKPIETITPGDRVLSHDGTYQTVLDSAYTGHKQCYKIKGMAIDEIVATGNHLFYVRKKSHVWNNNRRSYDRVFSTPQWTQVKDLKLGDYIGTPIIKAEENPLELTETECWLIGRYIADGYVRGGQRKDRPDGSKHTTVVFCIGKSKSDYFESKIENIRYGKSSERTVNRYSIVSTRLCGICKECGCGAENKMFPQFVLNLPIRLLSIVIDGYMSGDGWYCEKQNKYTATSASRKLVYTLGLAVAKAYHATYSVYKVEMPETTVIEGRVVNQKTQYQIRYKTDVRKQDKAFYEDGYIWSPITSVELSDKLAVYDLTVANTHSFCVCNIAVHNCQDISIAGERAGLRDGERSNLFFEAIRIIKEMRKATNGEFPRFCVWENVEGARSSAKGDDFRCVIESICRIADESATIPRPKKWYDAGFVRGGGYSLAWRLYDTQYWPKTPQRRKRFYVVGDFRGESAYKILFKRKGSGGDNQKKSDQGQESAADSEGGVRGDYQFGVDCRNATIDKDKTHTLQSHQTGGINVNCIPSVMYDAKDGNEIDSVSPPPSPLSLSLYEAYQHHGYRESDIMGTLTANQNQTIRGDTPVIIDKTQPSIPTPIAAIADEDSLR